MNAVTAQTDMRLFYMEEIAAAWSFILPLLVSGVFIILG